MHHDIGVRPLPPSPYIEDELPTTPLPVARILPLLIGRISEGLTYTVIFPYINAMLLSFGVQEEKVGFWSGVVVSYGFHRISQC